MSLEYLNIIRPEEEKEYHHIKLQIRPLQSGAIIDSIKRTGAEPGKQIGASFPALKSLAQKHKKSAAVSLMLWHDQRREEQIIAIFLFPDNIPYGQTASIIKESISYEVAEYSGSQWLAERTDLEEILAEFRETENILIKIAMITAAARYCIKLKHSDKEIPEIVSGWILRHYDESYCEMIAERYRFKFNKG